MKSPVNETQSNGKTKFFVLVSVLFLAVIVETGCNTFWMHDGNWNWLAPFYLSAGLVIGLIPLFLFCKGHVYHVKQVPSFIPPLLAGIAAILFLIAGFRKILDVPIDYNYADMLPVIGEMCGRFMHHQPVYDPITDIWKGVQPVYLPAMWMPYMLPIATGIDMRWISFFAIVVAAILIMLPAGRKTNFLSLLVLIPLCILLYDIFFVHPDVLSMTEEPLVIFYFMLLGYFIYKKNSYGQGVAIALCLLSRYMLIFWVPFWLLYLFFTGKKREAVKTGMTAFILSLFLMFITGAIFHTDIFLSMPGSYLDSLNNPENTGYFTDLIQHGLSLARYFNYNDLRMLQKIEIISSIALSVGFLIAGLFTKNKIPSSIYGLCTLKICLVVFFGLIVFPYSYLFLTSAFFSVLILSAVLQNQAIGSPKSVVVQ